MLQRKANDKMKRELNKHLYETPEKYDGVEVVLGGWARNIRDSKAFGFIDLNDGSCFKSVQIVFEREKIANYDEIAKLNICSRKFRPVSVPLRSRGCISPEA